MVTTDSNATRDCTIRMPLLRVIADGMKDIFGKRLWRVYQTWSISRLFFTCRPSTIPRFVTFGVFDSLDGLAFWPDAHVFEKVHERQPSVTDFNALASVARVVRRLRIRAALNHSFPRLISGRGSVVCCVPV